MGHPLLFDISASRWNVMKFPPSIARLGGANFTTLPHFLVSGRQEHP
jgi:hypothetical protein